MTNTNLEGKICIITGASGGIGKETALALAKMNATIVALCRNPKKGNQTIEEIKQKSQNPNIKLFLADLSSQSEIQSVATKILETYEKIHILINNAGAFFQKRELSKDGIEMTFALNHMSYFLLTSLLLDRLKESTPSRIINVASGAHKMGKIDFENLQGEKKYRGFQIYGNSKLANILFTYQLARKLEGTDVSVNCLHPGVVASSFGLNNQGILRFLIKLAQKFMISSKEGAKTSVYLASSPEVSELSGKYFYQNSPIKSSPKSYDKELAQKLWQHSEALCQMHSGSNLNE